MKLIKNIILFVGCLLLYFLPTLLFKTDPRYYTSLKLPAYAPPSILFQIIWILLYIIFSLFISIKLSNQDLSLEMKIYFIINYSISFFFNKVFFVDHNLFLSFAVTFCSFISGLFIFLTALKRGKKQSLIFLPYILWTGFASILMAHIYFIN